MGFYIPSNEETLLQYGKKGMKWKKRKNPLAEAGDHLAEDLVYAVDKKAIDKHVEDAARDKKQSNGTWPIILVRLRVVFEMVRL